MPKISVVMSVYNGEKYLAQAIESILAQTYTDFEYIIVNDGSTDGSLQVINDFQKKDNRIQIISRENKGLIYSLNEGIQKAHGEYIARMDADDIALPSRLAEQINFFQAHQNYMLVGSYAEIINENGKKTGILDYPPETWQKIKSYSFFHNPFIHPSVMFKKSLIDTVGGYNKNFKNREDYELWTRVIYAYPSANIPKPLIQYRIHDNQITRRRDIRSLFVRFLALWRFLF